MQMELQSDLGLACLLKPVSQLEISTIEADRYNAC